jgi:hypothetical protein
MMAFENPEWETHNDATCMLEPRELPLWYDLIVATRPFMVRSYIGGNARPR